MKEGGCFCGAIRFQAKGEPGSVVHCHCLDCRRASGAAFVTWVEFLLDDFEVTAGKATTRVHPEGVERTFCPTCGTTLTFHRLGRNTIDVTAVSLDNAEDLEPTDHMWWTRRLPWIHLDEDLPRFEKNRND